MKLLKLGWRKTRMLPVGKLCTSGRDLEIQEWPVSTALSLIITVLLYTGNFFHQASILFKLKKKILVSGKTAKECHSSALCGVCLCGICRLPGSQWHSFSISLHSLFIKRCSLAYIASRFTGYILFIWKTKKTCPQYALPFGAVCQMDTSQKLSNASESLAILFTSSCLSRSNGLRPWHFLLSL